jgi:hypothetical protein
MRSFRNCAYATVLGLSLFAVQPALAAAEDINGSFTLAHSVHWQKVLLRPGSYKYSIKSFGGSDFLLLRRTDGTGSQEMLMAQNIETSKPNQGSRLVLVSRGDQTFVSAMELPQHDVSLRFTVPALMPASVPTK